MTDATETHSETRSPGLMAVCWGARPQDRRNTRRILLWMGLWMASFLAAAFGLKSGLLEGKGPILAAITVTTLLGIASVAAYVRYVRDADELQGRIQLEGLAWGFAGAFLSQFTLRLLERAGLGNTDRIDSFLVMCVCYAIGVVVASRRYA